MPGRHAEARDIRGINLSLSVTCQPMANLLGPWGVDAAAERVYRAVLKEPGLGIAELASRFAGAETEVDAALRGLSRIGLVSEVSGGYVAEAPSTTLDRLVATEQARIDRRAEQLRALRSVIPQLAADHLAGQAQRWTHLGCDMVAGAEVATALDDLSRAARGPLRCLWPLPHEEPAVREISVREQALGRDVRTVVPVRILDEPSRLIGLRQRIELGERLRIGAQVPTRLLVFGEQAAMIAATADPADDRQIVVRTPALVLALIELFERVWDQAVAPPASGGAGPERDRERLLELLALGAKDETAARHLGMSVRTVRRRVADVLDELGASTRFQAGMQAARRGWI
jgi:DNA-binding CsgD family transcriptional regulator